MNIYENVRNRAEALLKELSLEEKLYQLSGCMIFSVEENYEEIRNPLHGNYRNPGHFMHATRKVPASPSEVAARINRDMKLSIEAQPHNIPPIEHGEALHGGQWGMATVFPQPIGMASTFDDELVSQIGDAIGKECACVGVRQVLAPVVNITRDCRWGRCMETFGEDVLLSSNMGVAITKGLEQNGVIATPKHYADNYSYGGRDSNVSDTSERTMREVFLKPFEKCFKEGGAHSVMAAYNSWDGIPCSCNKKLLTDILRDEWGFDGFSVSDYWGMEGVCNSHHLTDECYKAQAMCIKAGLDLNLPLDSFEQLKKAYEMGDLPIEAIDTSVLRILTQKFRLGLFENPYVDEHAAEEIVRCNRHKELALKGARESIILLKNNHTLPLDKKKIKKLAVFGVSAKEFPLGKNYSGPYQCAWTAPDAKTPLQYLQEALGNEIEILFGLDDQIEEIAPQCDAALYFTSVVEGEGMDRSDIRLPSVTTVRQKDDNAMIVGKFSTTIVADQEQSIRTMASANKNAIVVLLNGAPLDMTAWSDVVPAILESWYPGEQGAQALYEILFGEITPSAKLPITIPRSVGQLPLFYAHKPSGRGYGYNENDGSPLYPFGYGLSYTTFALSDFTHHVKENNIFVTFDIENTGSYEGAEVVQVYISGRNCDVVMPLKELKAYKRVLLTVGEKQRITVKVPEESFFYYNQKLQYGLHDGDFQIMVGNSCENIIHKFEVKSRNGMILEK